MKEQQKQIINIKRRRAFAWVASFVLLFGLLAMPMTPTMPRTQGELVIWGNFCTGSASKLVATTVNLGDQQAPAPANHFLMHDCPCCSGSLTMVAIPGDASFGLFSLIEPVRFPSSVVVIHGPPRLQWPSANPRASPRV